MIPGLSGKEMLEWYRGRVRELKAALHVAENNEEDRAGQIVELEEKVRELEAELAGTRSTVRTLLDERHEQLARAEKAEARVAELEASNDAMRQALGGPISVDRPLYFACGHPADAECRGYHGD